MFPPKGVSCIDLYLTTQHPFCVQVEVLNHGSKQTFPEVTKCPAFGHVRQPSAVNPSSRRRSTLRRPDGQSDTTSSAQKSHDEL